MNLKVVSLAAVATAACAASALAHHSFAMFDAEKTITLQGTVKEFEWVNPHSWLRINVNDEKTGKAALHAALDAVANCHDAAGCRAAEQAERTAMRN